jgi:GNAT superfamily N-acetyltransferase
MVSPRVTHEPDRSKAVIVSLLQSGLLEPVTNRTDDAKLWTACDLCSAVDNRFHVAVDPATMTDADFDSWSKRALAKFESLPDPSSSSFDESFFVQSGTRRVGAISLSRMTAGSPFLSVFSLYVMPSERGKGIAARTLRSINDAAVAAGFRGIRLGTHWTWHRALRLYLKLNMWAYSFKRSIEFVWMTNLPRYVIDIAGDTATFSIATDGGPTAVLIARRDGDRLIYDETPWMKARDECDDLRLRAHSTFAVALALEGWPLLPSPNALSRSMAGDVGGPEVLAYKIAVFEHLDRTSGFDVRTPRIPGLPYEEIARRMEET